ncbi:MAG: hypothetical protein PVF83_14100 [Anaerolineales bacterium]|jgi:hypothetical protein
MTSSDKRSGKNQPRLEDLIPLKKAAKISGLSHDHLRRLIREEKLWGIKIGWSWATTEQAVREYLARDRKPGPKKKK